MRVESLILADAAKVVEGKLYLLGGGWTNLTAETIPVSTHCGVAASFEVPWNETNQRHNVEIEVATDDGETLAIVRGQLEAGRPPGTPAGQSQRAMFAFEMNLTAQKLGTYAIIARIEGVEDRRVFFNVVPSPLLLLKMQQESEGAA